MLRILLTGLLLASSASAAAAQFARRPAKGAPEIRACALRRSPAGDSTQAMERVYVTVGAFDRSGVIPEYYRRALIGELGTRFRPPAADSVRGTGWVRATIAADGAISDVAIDSTGASPAVDSALVRAISYAGSMKALAFQAPDRFRRSTTLRFRAERRPDTPEPGEATEETMVGMVPGNPPLWIPASAAARGLGDRVLVRFVVGEDGRIEPESFQLRDARFAEYVGTVIAVLPYYRFQPATLHGCGMRQEAQIPFVFQIQR